MAQAVKNLPAMQETQVQSLGQEDPLEKEIATHSSILVWRIPWTEEPGEVQSVGSQRVRHHRVTNTFISLGVRVDLDVSDIILLYPQHLHQCPDTFNIVIEDDIDKE